MRRLVMSTDYAKARLYCHMIFGDTDDLVYVDSIHKILGVKDSVLHIMGTHSYMAIRDYKDIRSYCKTHNIRVISHNSHN